MYLFWWKCLSHRIHVWYIYQHLAYIIHYTMKISQKVGKGIINGSYGNDFGVAPKQEKSGEKPEGF